MQLSSECVAGGFEFLFHSRCTGLRRELPVELLKFLEGLLCLLRFCDVLERLRQPSGDFPE